MRLSFLLISILGSVVVQAQENQQFSTEFINGRFNSDAVEKALNNGLNAKVIYSVQINGHSVGSYYFSRKGSHLIFSDKFYQEALFAILSKNLRTTLREDMYLDSETERYTLTENQTASSLSVWFHDADLQHAQGDDDEPLSQTINGLMVNYNTSANYFRNLDDDSTETSLPLNSHIRLAMYDFPVDLDVSSSDIIHDEINVDNFSISHLLPTIQSQVSAGQTYTNSRYAEGFSFYGVKLNSVDDLRSRHDRYYTPNITGYARTNATVEVYQDKRLLFTKTVAAGQFVIDEVQGLSNQTLRVVVKESDGTQNTFFYENTVVPGLLTPGTYSYEVNSGRYRFSDDNVADGFVSAEYSHGFNWLTATINSVVSGNYKNLTVGGAFPLRALGALGGAASVSGFRNGDEKYQGQSYSLNYAKYLNNGFNLQMAGYRYSSRHYLSFNDAMQIKRSGTDKTGTLRNRFSATLMMPDPFMGNQVALNVMHSNYWSGSPATDTYSLSYGGYARGVGYNLSVAKSYTGDLDSDVSISLSLNIPLRSPGKSVYTRYNHDQYNNTTEVGLNSYDENGSYTVSASRNFHNNDSAVNGTYSRASSRYDSQIAGNISTHSTYASGSLNGTLAVADNHLLLSSSQASTMAVVKMNGADNARVNGIALQPNGYALVPLNDSFDSQDVTVDADSLSNNTLLTQNQVRIRPRRGELTRVIFTGKKVKFVRAILLDNSGLPLAFGTELTRLDTGDVIFAGNGGGVLLQKVMSAETTQDDLVLRDSDNRCDYTFSWRRLMSSKNESSDFIDTGKLTCKRN
jgi:outer membrane usher protein FimD/PapC